MKRPMMNRLDPRRLTLACCVLLLPVTASHASEADELIARINEYRQSPEQCQGRPARPLGPLAPDEALSGLRLDSEADWQSALQEAGYQAARAQAVALSGPRTLDSAMAAIKQRYCSVLLDPQFADIGVSHEGNTWQLVLARPLLTDDLGDWQQAGEQVLQQVNQARREARTCGDRRFEPAPALEWNPRLASTALAHSRDMAAQNYFSHQGRDGSQVGDRAEREGYRWQRIGENIAAGQGSTEQVVAGWLASPGHCATIMDPAFTELGVAYATEPESDAVIYWTQVFGRPR